MKRVLLASAFAAALTLPALSMAQAEPGSGVNSGWSSTGQSMYQRPARGPAYRMDYGYAPRVVIEPRYGYGYGYAEGPWYGGSYPTYMFEDPRVDY